MWRITLRLCTQEGPCGRAPTAVREGEPLPLEQRAVRPDMWEGLATALQLEDTLGDMRSPNVLDKLRAAPPRKGCPRCR